MHTDKIFITHIILLNKARRVLHRACMKTFKYTHIYTDSNCVCKNSKRAEVLNAHCWGHAQW